jgi:hypothetical protein
MVNRDQPHVLVLPEDRANLQLATGFHNEVDATKQRQMQVLPVAGGWRRVLERFTSDHVDKMRSNPNRFMVLLIDFDGRLQRLDLAKAVIPPELADRVFVLGARERPETLKAALNNKSCETIGSGLGRDCREDTYATWGHELLQHNKNELDRLREHVRTILF